MEKRYKGIGLITILMLLTVVVSCSSDGDGPAPVEPRTAEDIREDFGNLVINDGENDFAIESLVNNVFWNFRINQPAGASDSNKRPLIINLHGGALNDFPNAHKVTSCLVLPAFANLEPFVIRPNSNEQLWHEQPNQVQVLALLDLAKEFLPIDESKIIITGFSDGGNGSFFFAQFYPQLFSAAIPMATSYNTEDSSGQPHKFAIPIYAIHGENDDLFDLSITQGYIDDSIAAGSDLTFVVANGLDHYSGCDYAPYMADVEDWLVNHVWN